MWAPQRITTALSTRLPNLRTRKMASNCREEPEEQKLREPTRKRHERNTNHKLHPSYGKIHSNLQRDGQKHARRRREARIKGRRRKRGRRDEQRTPQQLYAHTPNTSTN